MSARLFQVLMFFLVICFFACSRGDGEKQSPVFKQIPEIQEIQPQKSAKIKLKRNASSDYAWEISGDDVDTIISVDRRLRENIKKDK